MFTRSPLLSEFCVTLEVVAGEGEVTAAAAGFLTPATGVAVLAGGRAVVVLVGVAVLAWGVATAPELTSSRRPWSLFMPFIRSNAEAVSPTFFA